MFDRKLINKNSLIAGILLILLLIPAQTEAQIWLSNKDIYDEAEEFLNAHEYVEALPLYLLLEKKDLLNANISYKIGECYLNIRGKKHQAVPYLEYAVKNASSRYKNQFSETRAPLKSILLLGIAYRIQNQLDLSVRQFKILRDSIGKKDVEFISVIDMHLARCENARLMNAFPGEARTQRLPDNINTEYSNYNPVLVDHDRVLYYMEELKFYDALMRVEIIDGKWQTPVNITPAIGSDGDHIIVSASANGKILFLYLYNPPNAGDIFVTYHTDNGWTKIKPLNKNINTAYHETHASISPDGSTLYFTSNRPGGYGGLDIYKSVADQSGNWGPAINLGPVINTPFNEETPIINTDDEILYFSSQGHLNMGGYDIFYALRKGENEFYQPVNMGSPVCTTDDDLFYYPLEELVSGLMSRIEQPSYGYDIYQYNSMTFANSPRFAVRGKSDAVDTANYQDSYIAIVNKSTNDTVQFLNVKPDGNYEALLPAGDFEVVVFVSGEPVTTGLVSLDDSRLHELTMITPASSGLKEDITATLTAGVDTFWISDILFQFDSYTVPAEYNAFLKGLAALLEKYPSLRLIIEGYTDAIGPESYNNSLSLKRAESVASMIAGQHISKDRISFVGYGEKKPVAPNKNQDGSDNVEGRKLNRRVVIVPRNGIEGLIILDSKAADAIRIQGSYD